MEHWDVNFFKLSTPKERESGGVVVVDHRGPEPRHEEAARS